VVEYTGPSGQGDIVIKGKSTGTVNVQYGANGVKVFVMDPAAVSTNAGTVINSGTVTNSGAVVNSGTVTSSGNVVNSGTVTSSGAVTNSGSVVNSGTVNNSSTVVNSGTVTNSGTSARSGLVVDVGTSLSMSLPTTTQTVAASYYILEPSLVSTLLLASATSEGVVLDIVNNAATNVILNDAGYVKLSGTITLGLHDTLRLKSVGTNWVEWSTSDN
jgi:hypothetical protein